MGMQQPRLDGKHRLRDSWRLDGGRRRGCEPGQIPLAQTRGSVNGGVVCRLDKVFGDDVDDAFARLEDVAGSVFQGAYAGREADSEDGGVVVDDLEV